VAKRLIINADDFGQSRGINRAIVECAEDGILTSATLMANGAAFEEAAQLVQGAHFGVGCHVVLVDGIPLSPAHAVPTLNPNGQMRLSAAQIGRDAVLGRVDARDVESEGYAQIRRLQDSGVVVTHVDAHKHTHMFPAILRPLLQAAKRAGIHRIRNPFEPAWTMSLGQKISPSNAKRAIQVALLRRLHSQFRSQMHEQQFKTPDGALGVILTGTLDELTLCSMLDRMPEGTWELVCHPGYADAELRAQRTRLFESREIERKALLSAAVRETINRNGIELITFADL
jgi:hopanoid biosynthesis associated protein HpnK